MDDMPSVRHIATVVGLAAAVGAGAALVQDGRRRVAGRLAERAKPPQGVASAADGDQEAALDAARERLRARAETLRREIGEPDAR